MNLGCTADFWILGNIQTEIYSDYVFLFLLHFPHMMHRSSSLNTCKYVWYLTLSQKEFSKLKSTGRLNFFLLVESVGLGFFNYYFLFTVLVSFPAHTGDQICLQPHRHWVYLSLLSREIPGRDTKTFLTK